MKLLKRIYEQFVYSEYGIFITIITMLTLLVLITFIAESELTLLLNRLNLVNLPYVFEFASITLVLLIVSTSLRAVKTNGRVRVIVYAIFFAASASINFIIFTNTHWFLNDIRNDGFLFMSAISRLVVSLGILIGANIYIEMKIGIKLKQILKLLVYIILITSIFFSLRIDTLVIILNNFKYDLKLFTMIEYGTAIFLIIALAVNLRSYNITKSKERLQFILGVSILIIAQVIRLSFFEHSYLYSFIYSLYVFIAYIFFYNAIFGYSILEPISELIKEEKQIKLYAENLEVIVERRTKEMQAASIRLIQEIDYAKSIQQSLLPTKKVNFKKVVFVSEYFPCERLSGDFFDIYRLDETNIGMYVLDVSGHGVSAALMTMFCNNYIRSSEKLIMRYRGLKPNRNLKHFYEEFNKMQFPEEMYMVMFFASYCVESRVLTYSSGGINCYPLLMRKDGSYEYLDKSQGFPICKMSEFFTPSYSSEAIMLQKGDRVIFYTDGLIDSVKNSTISEEQLELVMYDYRDKPLKALNNKLKSYIDYKSGKNEDDITYFIMEI